MIFSCLSFDISSSRIFSVVEIIISETSFLSASRVLVISASNVLLAEVIIFSASVSALVCASDTICDALWLAFSIIMAASCLAFSSSALEFNLASSSES